MRAAVPMQHRAWESHEWLLLPDDYEAVPVRCARPARILDVNGDFTGGCVLGLMGRWTQDESAGLWKPLLSRPDFRAFAIREALLQPLELAFPALWVKPCVLQGKPGPHGIRITLVGVE